MSCGYGIIKQVSICGKSRVSCKRLVFLPDKDTVLSVSEHDFTLRKLATGATRQRLWGYVGQIGKSHKDAFKQINLMMNGTQALVISRQSIYLVPTTQIDQMICIYSSRSIILAVYPLDAYHFLIVEEAGDISLRVFTVQSSSATHSP